MIVGGAKDGYYMNLESQSLQDSKKESISAIDRCANTWINDATAFATIVQFSARSCEHTGHYVLTNLALLPITGMPRC